MNITFFDNPWQHFEVTDFLSTDELQEARKVFRGIGIPDKETPRLPFEINPKNVMREKMREVYNFLVPKFIYLCNEVDSFDENTEEIIIEADTIYPGFEYPIHNDLWTKKLSFVLQISEKGTGTRLYEYSDGSGNKRTVNWVPGGGGGFIRNKIHWHSFDTLVDDTIRQTFILTKRHKDVDHRRPDKHLIDKFFI